MQETLLTHYFYSDDTMHSTTTPLLLPPQSPFLPRLVARVVVAAFCAISILMTQVCSACSMTSTPLLKLLSAPLCTWHQEIILGGKHYDAKVSSDLTHLIRMCCIKSAQHKDSTQQLQLLMRWVYCTVHVEPVCGTLECVCSTIAFCVEICLCKDLAAACNSK